VSKSTFFAAAKMAVFAPIPIASDNIAVTVNARLLSKSLEA
jgi:hypothetical protein